MYKVKVVVECIFHVYAEDSDDAKDQVYDMIHPFRETL